MKPPVKHHDSHEAPREHDDSQTLFWIIGFRCLPLESQRQIPTRGSTRARGLGLTRVERDAARVEDGIGRSSAAPTSSPKSWVPCLCACMVAASKSFTNILSTKLRRHRRRRRIRATSSRVPHRRNAARAAQPRLGVLQLGDSASLRPRTFLQWRQPAL